MNENIKWLYEFARLDPDFKSFFPEPEFSPGKSYDEIINEAYKKHHNCGIFMEMFLWRRLQSEVVMLDGNSMEEISEKIESGIITLRLDFNKVNKIEDINNNIKRIINKLWQDFRKRHGHSRKYDTKDFKLIHLVGTLRKSKKTAGEIIKHPLFPRCKEPKRKLYSLLKDYENLGEQGGWKNYMK